MFERARARYLKAIGIEGLAAIAVAACQPSPAAPTEPVTTVTAPSAAPATGSAIAVAPPTSTAVATVTSPVPAVASSASSEPTLEPCPKPPPPRQPPGVVIPHFPMPSQFPLPTCPHGDFCVAQSSQPPTKSAPAPYAACADAVGGPPGVGWPGGPPPNVAFSPANTKEQRACHPSACCYTWVVPCPGGRGLRADGHALLATPSARRVDWRGRGARPSLEGIDPASREALAARWLREASFEHASVASFARVSLELLFLGAPPGLVADTHAAAADEVRHAELAYAMASAYGGAPTGPGPLPAVALTLAPPTFASLAASTFRDACVGETLASLEARAGGEHAADLAVVAALATIAEDETRHSELAWRTLAWAVRMGGASAASALAAELAELRRAIVAEGSPPDAEAGPLAGHGVLGESATTWLRVRALSEVVIPCAEALLASHEAESLRDLRA